MNATIKVKLFGGLREFGENGSAELHLPRVNSVAELRMSLAAYFAKNHPGSSGVAILQEAAIADEKSILASDAVIDDVLSVAVLPPVCGG